MANNKIQVVVPEVVPSPTTKDNISVPYSDWKTGLNPILRWMSIIGVFSDLKESNSYYYCKLIYRWIFFIFALVLQFLVTHNNFQNIDSLTIAITEGNSPVLKWNIIIEAVNLSTYITFGCTFVLILRGPKTWTMLVESIQQQSSLESTLSRNKDAIKSIRNLSIGAVTLVVISVITFKPFKFSFTKFSFSVEFS